MDWRPAWRQGRLWLSKEGKILRYSLPLLVLWIAISQFIDVKGHWTTVKETSAAVAAAFEKVDPWLMTKQFYGRLQECRYDWRFTCLKLPDFLEPPAHIGIVGVAAAGATAIADRPGCYTVNRVVPDPSRPAPRPGLVQPMPDIRWVRVTREECVPPRSIQWWPIFDHWMFVKTPGFSLPAIGGFWIPQAFFGLPDSMWETAKAASRESAAAAAILGIVVVTLVGLMILDMRTKDVSLKELFAVIVLSPLIASVMIYLLQGVYFVIGKVGGETMASVNSVPFLIAGIVAFPKIHKGVGLIHAARRLFGKKRSARKPE